MKPPIEPTKQDELNAVLQTLDKEVARLEAMDVHTILECWNLIDWRKRKNALKGAYHKINRRNKV